MFSRLLSWFFPAPAGRSKAPSPLPRSVRALSTDDQVRWVYRRFKPEVAVRIARGIRARAAASEGDKRPPIGARSFEFLCAA